MPVRERKEVEEVLHEWTIQTHTMSKPHLNRMQCTIHNVEYNECYSPKTNTATSCPVCMEERYHKTYDRAESAEKHVELLLSVIELKSTQILCQNVQVEGPADNATPPKP